VSWIRLAEATKIMDHDAQRARQALERGISKSWLVRLGGEPQPSLDPNVPLRIQVTPSPGWRIEGRGWLERPVLHWEDSEVECPCQPWAPARQNRPTTGTTPIRAKIEVWQEDILRLWGGDSGRPDAAE
jgi:hypothetical protein